MVATERNTRGGGYRDPLPSVIGFLKSRVLLSRWRLRMEVNFNSSFPW